MKRLFLALLFLPLSFLWAESGYYDEIFDTNGKIRPQYLQAYAAYKEMGPAAVEAFKHKSNQEFWNDNALFPLPRLILEEEMETLRKGVAQRGEALRRFLQDHYSGKKSYLGAGIIPKEVLARIISRAGEMGYEGHLKPETIAFNYGPDILRAGNGRWHVIEDNPGYVGGFGDIKMARDILMRDMAVYKSLLKVKDNPVNFYRNLVERYRQQMKDREGKMVLYVLPENMTTDHEDQRMIEIYKEYGIEVVTPYEPGRKLIVKNGEVYLRIKQKRSPPRLEKVGFIILNAEIRDIDMSFQVTARQGILEEAKEHLEFYELLLDKSKQRDLSPEDRELVEWGKKIPIDQRQEAHRQIKEAIDLAVKAPNSDLTPLKEVVKRFSYLYFEFYNDQAMRPTGVLKAIMEGKVGSNYSPGVDFIGDKEFYKYVEPMIRHYLKQEPIITNIPTGTFYQTDADGVSRISTSEMDKVFEKASEYVIKAVDGRGGKAVWIGSKMTPEEIAQLRAKITKDPTNYIHQPFLELSRWAGHLVDLRMLSVVDSLGVLVGETPWGRGVPIDGDGKVNLSANGVETPVVVVEHRRRPCLKLKKSLPPNL